MFTLADMPTNPEVMTRAEVARRLDVTTMTVMRWTETGRLAAVRSDPWLYNAADVDKLAAELADEHEAKAAALRAPASP